MKTFYVYLITNTILNKQYVGSHVWKSTNNSYMGSSKYLNEDYIIFGEENFTKQILNDTYQNMKELLDAETKYILEYNTLVPNGYNRFLPNKRNSFHFHGCKHTKESLEKMSVCHKGFKHSDKTIKKMKKVHTGTTHTEQTKNKMKQTQTGHIVLEETKVKISKANKGRKFSEEVNKKKGLSGELNHFYGKTHTNESIQKMKKSHNFSEIGKQSLKKPKSEETKKKISDAQKKRLAKKFSLENC